MKISVPATTANLGPGFDSIGVALNLYLSIEIISESDDWIIEHDLGDLPADETNLVIKVAKQVYPNIKAHRLSMTSDIPTSRGLGSSASAIVAGIELGNQLGHLQLTNDEKLRIATEIEGHPDNVAPAILGEMVISKVNESGELFYVRHPFPDCQIHVIVPSYHLSTKDSRQVLPKELPYGEAVDASATANVMVASLLTNQLEQAGKLMMSDKWHEPYREKLVKELTHVKKLQKRLGYYSATLSGAGPTVLLLSPIEVLDGTFDLLEQEFPNCQIVSLKVDKQGINVQK